MRYAIMLVILSSLAGCATTHTLKASDCATADWQAVGYADGKRGASSQIILRHAKVCQGVGKPDRQAWETGRQKGLGEFCTPTNAYNLGRMGYTLTSVCETNLEQLHRANMMGLEQYALRQRLNYHHGYYGIYGHPWYVPYYW